MHLVLEFNRSRFKILLWLLFLSLFMSISSVTYSTEILQVLLFCIANNARYQMLFHPRAQLHFYCFPLLNMDSREHYCSFSMLSSYFKMLAEFTGKCTFSPETYIRNWRTFAAIRNWQTEHSRGNRQNIMKNNYMNHGERFIRLHFVYDRKTGA